LSEKPSVTTIDALRGKIMSQEIPTAMSGVLRDGGQDLLFAYPISGPDTFKPTGNYEADMDMLRAITAHWVVSTDPVEHERLELAHREIAQHYQRPTGRSPRALKRAFERKERRRHRRSR
jgi:hypothetical protein